MTNTIVTAASAVKAAYAKFNTQRVVRDADRFIQQEIKGMVVELRPGTVITVSSVMNAGFNGMQVGGYTANGDYRIGCYR